VDGRSTSSHDSKKFRTRSMEKQGGMEFGFQKKATAVVKPDRRMRGVDCDDDTNIIALDWISVA
jgi:hypothetical protein